MVLLCSGCFSPDLGEGGACQVSCHAGCPKGWTCSEDKFCIPKGFGGACHSGAGGNATGGAVTSSSGGTYSSAGSHADGGTAPGGSSTNGGAPVSGGEGGEAGATGGGGAGGSLDVQLVVPGNLCSGDIALHATVTGGVPPYAWSLENSCGLSLAPGATATAHITGAATPSANCSIKLDVHDDADAQGRLISPLVIHEVPSIELGKLRAACLSEEYVTTLSASGGDSATRTYETDTAGWSIVGDQLRTTVSDATPLTVSVSVHDAYCASAPVELALAIEAPDSTRCFRLSSNPLPLPTAPVQSLPQPCAGMPYSVDLKVSPEPASWMKVALPPGLRLDSVPSDPSAILIRGSADWAAGEKSSVQFRVVGADGRQFLYDYELTPRDKCWLAYVGNDAGPWQLHLYDPELRARNDFGSTDGAVINMAFSPDGKFLVYQSELAQTVDLNLIDLSNLHEQPLAFSGSVEHYQWSPDSALLAVVSRAADTTLGGIDVLGISKSSQGSTGIHGFTYLEPLTTGIETAPVWFGDHSLVLTAHPIGNPLTLFTHFAQVQGAVFSSERAMIPTYDEPLTLLGFPRGYVAGDGFLLDFYYFSENSTFQRYPHDGISSTALAPNGAYFANTDDAQQLSWFSPASLDWQDDPAARSEPSLCGALLAWADAGDRNACVTGSGDNSLRFFERSTVMPGVLNSTPSSTNYVYSEQSSNERRRVFSKGGRRFAFTTTASLYVVDLDNPRFLREYASPAGVSDAERAKQADTIDLAFSTDALFLVEHRGKRLTLEDLSVENRGYWAVSNAMRLAPNCDEAYMSAPLAWCGAASAPRDFKWSPRAASLAYRNEAGALIIVHLSPGFGSLDDNPVNPGCSGDCIRSFEFQP
ncbi:MAG: WD40 repeat domain-containing protein [Polyangiaceae bacterium]